MNVAIARTSAGEAYAEKARIAHAGGHKHAALRLRHALLRARVAHKLTASPAVMPRPALRRGRLRGALPSERVLARAAA